MKANQSTNFEEGTTIEQKQPKVAQDNQESHISGAWKSILVGGVPGIIFGTAGTVFAQEAVDTNIDVEGNNEEITEGNNEEHQSTAESHVNPDETGVQVAESVNDDMSFSEAFAAARAEVGPGGVFEWHGNLYGTYYATEWNAMSSEEKQDYSNRVYGLPHESTDADTSHENENTDEVDDNVKVEEYTENTDDETIEVQIHEVGVVTTEDGEMITAAVASVDGHNALIVDVDNDGYVDGVAIDANDDGTFQEDEVMETPDSDMNMSYLAMLADNPEDSLYAGTPDYTNDADTSCLA